MAVEFSPEDNKIELQILVNESCSSFASAGTAEELLKSAGSSFEQLGYSLGEAGSKFWASLEKTNIKKPQEIELTMNLSLEINGKWVIVSGKSGANISVKMKWIK